MEMKHAGWSVPTPAIRITRILYCTFLSFFYIFPIICLEWNSNPSETHDSNRVFYYDTHRWVTFLSGISSWVYYCQHKPALEPALTRFAVSQHRCSTITVTVTTWRDMLLFRDGHIDHCSSYLCYILFPTWVVFPCILIDYVGKCVLFLINIYVFWLTYNWNISPNLCFYFAIVNHLLDVRWAASSTQLKIVGVV